MELKDQQVINAPATEVFAALNDPEILKACIPGCESLEKTDETSMLATVAMKVGPVKARFKGSVKLENMNPPVSYTIVGEGKGGAAGFAKGSADVNLVEENGATSLNYAVKADIGGKLAQLGSRLIDSTAKKLSAEFFKKFAEAVEQEDNAEQAASVQPSEADTPAAVRSSTPTEQSQPNQKNLLLYGVGLVAVVILAYLFFR
ncbi:MAG: carbon monoxide dehydrogenase subunit G [Stappiaceae bacterium]